MPPRARGAVSVSTKTIDGKTALDGLRQSGSLKLVFPRRTSDALEGVLVNTAGGITGGDRFEVNATVGCGGQLVLTTQAAERAYRAQDGETGRLTTKLTLGEDARLHWLPQETILFDGCALKRRLSASLESSSRLLLCEPLVFGRQASGETLHRARFQDEIHIRRAGKVLFHDALKLDGDVTARLSRPAIADHAGAMATLLYVGADAESHLAPVRDRLGATAGASLLREDVLILRALAPDSFALRREITPLLARLSRAPLPRPWMI